MKRISILLVDDDHDDISIISEYIKNSMSDYFYAIDVADGHDEAINKVLHNKYDISLMDLNLPKVGIGYTASEILKITNTFPVVILTGINDDMLAKN